MKSPAIAGVFERHGVDYFCRGERSLQEALRDAGVSLDDFLREERACCQCAGPSLPDWRAVPLRILIHHIIARHHAFLHRELPALDALMASHDPITQWLPALRSLFRQLKRDIEVHMRKEETILFPAIVETEAAVITGRSPHPLPFGSVANFSRVLEQDHRRTGDVLHEMRGVTETFTCPPHAFANTRELVRRLQTLTADVHQHIHLENNVLFPRAIDLEKGELLCQ